MSRVGRFLLDEALVSEAQLAVAEDLRRAMGGTLGQNLVRAGAVDETSVRDLLCRRLGLEAVSPAALDSAGDEIAALIPTAIAVDHRVVPVALSGQLLVLAMADPSDDRTLAELARRTGHRIMPQVALESHLSRALERVYGTADPAELPGRRHLARWAEPVKVEPIELQPSRGSKLPDKKARPVATGYREPAILEGKYDRIRPEELPDDASAGYIPLTRVKPRGVPPSATPLSTVRSADSWDEPPASDEARQRPEPDPGTAPPLRSLDGAIRRLGAALDRDAAIRLALESILLECRRAAFFTVKRGVVEGFEASGDDIGRDQVRSVWIPLASPSTLRDVCEYGQARVGPVGDTRADAIFTAALGGRRGDSVMVPVLTGGRTVGVIYGDDLRSVAPSTGDLVRLGEALGEAISRLAKDRRRDIL